MIVTANTYISRRSRALLGGSHAAAITYSLQRRGLTGETWFPPCRGQGNICRCTGYVNIVEAIKSVSE